MRRAGLIALAALLAPTPFPAAADAGDGFREVAPTAPVRSDRAYLLVRVDAEGVGPTFLRVPTPEEMARYRAAKQAAVASKGDAAARDFVYDDIRNLVTVNVGKAFEKSGDLRTVLIEALPGSYVFYGIGLGQAMISCLCLGSVATTAAAGQVTDLGTIVIARADQPSNVPELAALTGKGPSMNGFTIGFAAALRPATGAAAVPAALADRKIVPARYRTVGTFVSPVGSAIAPLAPVAGVLGPSTAE